MTLPGLERASSPNGLAQKALDHVGRLRETGLLGEGLEMRATVVVELARRVEFAPAYAVAPLIAQLREALSDLPDQGGDAWDALIAAIRAGDRCPNCDCPRCAADREAIEL